MLKKLEYTRNMKLLNSVNITNNDEKKELHAKYQFFIFETNIIDDLETKSNINNSTFTIQNEILNRVQKAYKNKVLSLIRESENEWGCNSEFEKFLINNKRDRNLINILNEIFIDNIRNKEIIVKIFHAFSKLSYEDTYPNAQTMCLAAMSINDSEVKEAAIELFEAWRNKKALELLKILDIKESWLKKYRQQVVNEIEEEIENG